MIPTLTTDRLTLGPFAATHFDAFRQFAATDRATFLGGPTINARDVWDSCMIHLGQWVARGYGAFFATETATGHPCGRFSIWHPITFDEPELSWVVYNDFESKGYATEGASAVRDWAKTQGMTRLCSYIAPENTRSVTLAQRLGCTLEGPRDTPSGKPVDVWRHPV